MALDHLLISCLCDTESVCVCINLLILGVRMTMLSL